jgi:predicted transcriptional regulator
MESPWKTISDSSRRKILLLLKERDMTPTEISNNFQFALPAISIHLRTMILGILTSSNNHLLHVRPILEHKWKVTKHESCI